MARDIVLHTSPAVQVRRTRQDADAAHAHPHHRQNAAASINRLALENAEKAFGLHLAAVEENVNAAFAFAGELIDVRDAEGLKAVWPKGIQVARASAERSLGAAQEAFAGTIKTNEAIGTLAKTQFEQASSQVKAEVEKATKAASKASK